MAGGGAPAPKQDELQPHPVKDQLPGVSYCITSPPPWREFSDFVSFYLSNFLFICGNIKKKKVLWNSARFHGSRWGFFLEVFV